MAAWDKFVSTIDTDRFGFTIAKVNDIKLLTSTTGLKKFREVGVKLIISRIPSEQVSAVHALEEIGGRLMDIQATYRLEYDRQIIDNSYTNSDIVTRNAKEVDLPILMEIAESSFTNYGHYYADPRLEKKLIPGIYRDWIRRSVINNKVADCVLVATHNDEILGFLSFQIRSLNEKKYAAGGLGAVTNKSRGKNIFATLTLDGLSWGVDMGLDWMEHNVLINNYPVNRVFAKIGFISSASFLTFHLWLD